MIFAVDISYNALKTQAAGVLFDQWQSPRPSRTLVEQLGAPADYVSGSFYMRELPSILHLLELVEVRLEYIVVDGFVALGAEQRPGLGMKLWEALDRETPVIGVAKTRFHGTPPETQIWRGNSKSPLYVTAVGVPLDAAKICITEMNGPYRIPLLLKLVDRLSRDPIGLSGEG